MTAPLFLSPEDLRELTGFAHKDKQIHQLRDMGIPFRINGCGKPVVTRAAIEGTGEQQKPQGRWTPTVLQGGREGG